MLCDYVRSDPRRQSGIGEVPVELPHVSKPSSHAAPERIGLRHSANQEIVSSDALGCQYFQNDIGVRRQWTIVEGNHYLMVVKRQHQADMLKAWLVSMLLLALRAERKRNRQLVEMLARWVSLPACFRLSSE